MASVKLKNVSKVYDDKVKAVQNATLTIQDKEFVVLVGPSGCGKSTLLRMIAGLEDITEGEIYIDDKLVNNTPSKDRDIAMVFQNYALYPHMTVFENMAFGLKLRKFPKNEIRTRVEDAADILDIKEYLDRKPKALSGGQRQRVAVGRAIVRKPKVFLFDEPLSNLDAKLRVQTRIEINRLHNRLKTTMIYVTHDQIEAMTMGTQIVVLKDGIVQQVDDPLNLYKYPVNKFVAGFIGSPAMNFFNGKLVMAGDSIKFNNDIISFTLDNNLSNKLKPYFGKEIILGIRPENIYDSSVFNENMLLNDEEIEIELVEPIGNEIFIYFRSDLDLNYCMRVPSDKNYMTGQKLKLGFKSENIHFFNPESMERIP